MTSFFLDTSALIKRFVTETGTNWVRSVTTQGSPSSSGLLVAQITQVELASGIMRRQREGHLSSSTAHKIRLLINRQMRYRYTVISLKDEIIASSEDLLERHPLRAYDAIQLASALEANNGLLAAQSTPLIFVSADKRLLDAASAEGLSIDDPNAHL